MRIGKRRALKWLLMTIFLVFLYPCAFLIAQDSLQRFTIDLGDVAIALPGHYQATSCTLREYHLLRKTPIYWIYPKNSWEVILKIRHCSWPEATVKSFCVPPGPGPRTLSFISRKGYGSISVVGSADSVSKLIQKVRNDFIAAGFREITEGELKDVLLREIERKKQL